MRLSLLSVNVGMPRVIGTQDGRSVLSGIVKSPVTPLRIGVNETRLDGDGQADLQNHGGRDKAVYAYPSDNWAWWREEKQFPCAPAAFGENLTLEGADETEVFIGDRFSWGDCILEISQPRGPCFKFNMMSGRNDAAAIMTLSGRCGWYYRVVKTGEAPTRNCSLERISQGSDVSVHEIFHAAYDRRFTREKRKALMHTQPLSAAWKVVLRRSLEA